MVAHSRKLGVLSEVHAEDAAGLAELDRLPACRLEKAVVELLVVGLLKARAVPLLLLLGEDGEGRVVGQPS